MRTSPQKSLNVLVSIFLVGAVLGGSACRSRAVDVPSANIGRPVEAPVSANSCAENTSFLIGSGVYDITGPAAELGMMGYARIDQKTAGIHLRLRARAFVIATPCNGNRVAFVSADLGQIFQVMKQQVVAKLQTTYGPMYTDANVMLSATHTHSGPGGTSHYALYDLTILGFDQQNLNAVVDGIYQAIVRAHNNLDAGTITVASGDLTDASINRSPEAYRWNPEAERAQYASDTNTLMTLLRLQKRTGLEMGSQQPFLWSPEVLPLQLVRLGNLVLVATPFEVTTMAGRRLRHTVLAPLEPAGVTRVVIVGLANAYAGYMTTREEYAQQDYEGASTHFGPWQLSAVQQEMDKLAVALRDNLPIAPGPTPRDLSCCQVTIQTGVVFDDKPPDQHFGSVITDANASYSRGQTVSVVFWGGHPKNNLRIQDSFLQVQQKNADGTWSVMAYDWDWETTYTWSRDHCLACSRNTVQWTIPSTAAPGTYRIRHDGTWKSVDGSMHPYVGFSREFTVD